MICKENYKKKYQIIVYNNLVNEWRHKVLNIMNNLWILKKNVIWPQRNKECKENKNNFNKIKQEGKDRKRRKEWGKGK